MALKLFRRNEAPAPAPIPAAQPLRSDAVTFDGLTEGYRLRGTISLADKDRLSDILNRRESLAIRDVVRGPIAAADHWVPAPEIESIDPYGFSLIFAGPDSRPDYSNAEAAAHKVRKQSHRVKLEVAAFEVIGTVWLNPGFSAVELLSGRVQNLFLPVTGAQVWWGQLPLDSGAADVVLVNRFELHALRNL